MPKILSINDGRFIDSYNRTVTLRGINFAADSKFPCQNDRYVGSPVPLEEADTHYARLSSLGFNCLRYIYTWDAIEHEGPGKYDEEYINYTIEMLRKAAAHGFYVFLDPHQDAWSRFSGGSGAPLWTLYAAGFDPRYFKETEAAAIYDPNDQRKIKMLWASNYHRLVSLTMFTLFFAGEEYAPKCQINGKNVGTYIHDHYIAALQHFMKRIENAKIDAIIGWESLNEPGHGYIGIWDLNAISESLVHVKLGPSPTPFQGMLLGQGIAQKVDTYTFSTIGFRKGCPVSVRPTRGCWLEPQDLLQIDSKYEWKRSWPGGCIWMLHGVYNDVGELKQPHYFRSSEFTTDERRFVQTYFLKHWRRFCRIVHDINDHWFVLMQAPVNHAPPDFRELGWSLDVARTVYTPHYYDGLTLMLKRWQPVNVDMIGLTRHQYRASIFAVRIGRRAIRTSMANQLKYIKSEGNCILGNIPCLVSEIGIPYDMNNKRAYTDGLYAHQIEAMDANHNALEASTLSHTLWNYTACNTHEDGDHWCGEDLSIWSMDDCKINSQGMSDDGVRAAIAVIRPTPVAVCGKIQKYSFDIYKAEFCLHLIGAPTSEITAPTKLFVPEYHFPRANTEIILSGGETRWTEHQHLEWVHGAGKHFILIRGVPRLQVTWYSMFKPLLQTIFEMWQKYWGKSNI